MENNVRVLAGDKIASHYQGERNEFTKENFERMEIEMSQLKASFKELETENQKALNEARYFRKRCLALYEKLDEKEPESKVIFLQVAI